MSESKRGVRRRQWGPAEDQAIRELYGKIPSAELSQQLGRTIAAIRVRASILRATGNCPHPGEWTAAELADLRRSFSAEPATVIAARLGRSASAVSQQGRALGLTGRKALIIASVVHDYFSVIDSPEQAYILGLLAADGNVTTGFPRIILGQQAKDAHLVSWVRDRLNPAAELSLRPNGYAVLQVTSRQMVTDLARHGIVPSKSRVLVWPADLGPLQRPFLLGYFDGDGSAYLPRDRRGRERPAWTVCSGSEAFLVSLRAYIAVEAGVQLWRIQHRPGADLWQTAVTGRGAWVLDEWLHQDGLGLARKRFPEHVVAPYRCA